MSYILDALKRAEAQREQGSVPGLHARQLASLSAPAARSSGRPVWSMAAVLLVLVALAAGLWVWRERAPVAGTSEAPATALRVAPAEAKAQASAAVVPSVPVPAPVPLASAAVEQAKPNVPVQALAVAAPPAQVRSVAARPGATAPVKVTEPAVAGAPLAAPPLKAAEVVASVPLFGDLPEELRRQIPTLNISGAVYSEHPGQRMLLVNGLVLKQGDLAAPELSLEEIRARSSVFSFRGTRFRLAH